MTAAGGRLTLPKSLLALGLLSSAMAWWLIAPPVMTFSSTEKHAGHFGLVYFHVSGGTLMLFVGLANLYVGTTRKYFKYHRVIGYVYLVGGALGAVAAMAITSSPAHIWLSWVGPLVVSEVALQWSAGAGKPIKTGAVRGAA